MASITIDGLDEEVFRRNIEAMLRVGEADRAAAKLRALIEPHAGEGKTLPARFLTVSAADIEIVGWDELGEQLARNDRPRHRISALTIAVADAEALDLEPPFNAPTAPKKAAPTPLIATSHYTDEAFPFSDSGMGDLLDGYTFYGCEWHGSSAHMDLSLSLAGIGDLYEAVAALEAELIACKAPKVDQIRAGSLASCYLAVLLYQAVRDTIKTKGVPRALCVTAGNEGVYPYFDAPVIGSAECVEQGLIAEPEAASVEAEAAAEEDAPAPAASLADLVVAVNDDAAELEAEIGAARAVGDSSFAYDRLLGMTGRRSEKKPVLQLAEAELRNAAEMFERAGEERMGSRAEPVSEDLLAHHGAPRPLTVLTGDGAEPDVFADSRVFHELIGPRRAAPPADPAPEAVPTGPIWTEVAWRAGEAGEPANDEIDAESADAEPAAIESVEHAEPLPEPEAELAADEPAAEAAPALTAALIDPPVAEQPVGAESEAYEPQVRRSHGLRARIAEVPQPEVAPPPPAPTGPFAAFMRWLRGLFGGGTVS